ncbi:hypothetical protein RHDE110596_02345 [Prescottella defluvii]
MLFAWSPWLRIAAIETIRYTNILDTTDHQRITVSACE